MSQAENFLHTTHRTVTWLSKAFNQEELELVPPFQRNAVWTKLQKSYLIDTILSALPIPELYMQDVVSEFGEEKHVVADGQQRIRAVLDYINDTYYLDGDNISKQWRGRKFSALSTEEKKTNFTYKFVVRILPPSLREEDIRGIFARINKNVVSLTDQELRNAAYWGPFIKSIQHMADEDPFWASSGIFSANDHRRMIDHEYISELAIAFLHGNQNKKDKLDFYYRLYEESFENEDLLKATFYNSTKEISNLIPNLSSTRWRKKSDFYTLFLQICSNIEQIKGGHVDRRHVSQKIIDFGNKVDSLLRLEESEWGIQAAEVLSYAKNVARAASDKGNRIARAAAFSKYVFDKDLSSNTAETDKDEIAEVLFGSEARDYAPPLESSVE